jgi:hypothetical protein
MIGDETYCGVWRFGYVAIVNKKKVRRNKSDLKPIAVPAIVDRATWEAAQKQKKENAAKSKRNCTHDYLFRGLIVCGQCEGKFTCQSRMRKGWNHRYLCFSKFKRYRSRKWTKFTPN